MTSLLACPALAEVPRVVTDIHPVHSLVAQVMGDLGTPALLLSKGADEHAFQLKPSQAAQIANAGLVVWVGPELTPWLDRALNAASPDVARLGLLAAEGTHRQDFISTGATDPATRTPDPVEDHDHEGHAHGDLDPHAWLDPANARLWLALIAAELSRLDPDNAPRYAANAAAAADRIAALEGDIAATLAPIQGRPLVVFHDAYGYFAGHYGLTIAGTVTLGDAASPGAARLSALRDSLKADDTPCIFPEAQHDPSLVAQLADGSGARIGGAIDPSGSSFEAGPGLYAAMMTDLAATLAACAAR